MATVDRIKARLPDFIVQNQLSDDLLGAIGASIDSLIAAIDGLRANLTVEKATGVYLNALARDMGQFRAEGEGDRLLRVFLMNGQEIYRRRGSRAGIEDEIARLCKSSAFLHYKAFTLGDDYLLPADEQNDGLGNDLLNTSILVHNATELTEDEIKALVESIVPVHVQYGVEVIDVSGAQDATYKRQVGADFSGAPTLSGFEVLSGVLVPDDIGGVMISKSTDLGSGYADHTWAIDWLEYRPYRRLIDLLVEARFGDSAIISMTKLSSDFPAAQTWLGVEDCEMVYSDRAFLDAHGNKELISISGYSINYVSLPLNYFRVAGDKTSEFTEGTKLCVNGSSSNDGIYTVTSSDYVDPNTRIFVVETIPSSTADGVILFTGEGPYKYLSVQRDVDGSGADDWYAGDTLIHVGPAGTLWTGWTDYRKNGVIPAGVLDRYIQYRLKLALGYHRIDRCLFYDGAAGTYTDYTDEANFDGHVPLDGMMTADYLYLGMGGERFAGLQIDIGSNPNAQAAVLAVEYWNGSIWGSAGAIDRTASAGKTMAQDGLISWPWPTDWARSLVNGERLYWVRLSVSSNLSATVDLDGIDVPDVGVDDWALERLIMKGYTDKQY